MNTEQLNLEFRPSGKNGHAVVILRPPEHPPYSDTVNLLSAKARERYLDQMVKKFPGLESQRNAIEARLLQWAAEHDQNHTEPQDADPKELLQRMPEAIRAQARAMLKSPDLAKQILDDIATLGIAGEKELSMTVYLIGTSRLLSKPLAAIVQGPSSSGKSFVVETVGRLFPPEAVILATQITPQALYHLPPGRLKHRFIITGERHRAENDETADATRALREMLSSGKLTKLISTKTEAGRVETEEIIQEGPIAYIETTTLSKIFDEDANRCLLLNTDERPEQTKKILAEISRRAKTGKSNAPDEDAIIQKHHALQRMLDQWPVVIPYADRLADMIPADRVEVRRAFPQLLSMIKASALLHQRQRKLDPDFALVANEDDYKLARLLLGQPLGKSIGRRVSDPARRFYDRLRKWFAANEEFTTRDAMNQESCSRSAVYGWLAELSDAGLIERAQDSYGRNPAKWKIIDPARDPEDDCVLPPPEKLFP